MNFGAQPSVGNFSFETPASGGNTRSMPWDFPPGSPGSKPPTDPPASFLRTLADMFPGWVVTWHPITERHCLYDGDGNLKFYCQNPYPHEWADVPQGGPIPLDNRVFAFLHDSNPDNYGGLKAMREEIARRRDLIATAEDKRRNDWMDEIWHSARQHSIPRIGYGGGRGDRFSREVTGEASRDFNIVPY